MKLAYLLGNVMELFGISDRINVLRKGSYLINLLRNTEVEDADLQIENTFIENVPVRIARPLNSLNRELPVIVYFHGGAFYFGSVDTHNSLTSTLARSANMIVISVNYRLAPEHPFPAGLEDCYTVAKYILEYKQSRKLFIDPTKIIIAGDSAGGSLAAIVTMRLSLNRVSQYPPRLQLLIYPSLQFFDLMLPSYIEKHYRFLYYTIPHKLSAYLNQTIDQSIYANKHTSIAQKQFYRKYVDWSFLPKHNEFQAEIDNNEGDPVLIEKSAQILDPEISPLLVEDAKLVKLPSTYIITVGHDRLRDEGFIYAGRLKQIGVPIVHKHYEHTFHGSITLLFGRFQLDIAKEMVQDIIDFFFFENISSP